VEYNFVTIDADQNVEKIIEDLKLPITQLLRNRLPKEMKPN
jgi:hypothetical protein